MKHLLLFFISALAWIGLCPAVQAEMALPSHAAADTFDIPIQELVLDGFNAWLVEEHRQPMFSLQITFKHAGSRSDPKGKEGRAMFAASLLDEGAGDMDALAFQQALESRAIELSISTDDDALHITMRSLAEHREDAFRLLGLALTQPRFDASDVARKREKALSTLRQSASNPAYIMRETLQTLAYPGHPYSQPEIGTESSIQAMDAADLQTYVREHLARDVMLVSVAGDIQKLEAATLLNAAFSSLPKAAVVTMPERVQLANPGHMEVVEQPIPQSMLTFATPAIFRDDPRFMAGFVLNQVVGGDTLTSLFGQEIRKQRGLAYSVHTGLMPMDFSSSFGGMFATRNEQAGEAYQALVAVSRQLAEGGINADDLARSKQYLIGSFARSLDTNGELVHYLNMMQRYHLGMDYLQTRNAKIAAVTLDEVNALAREWLQPEKWLVVVVGKPAGMQTGNTLP